MGALVVEDSGAPYQNPKDLLRSMRSKVVPHNIGGYVKFRVSISGKNLWMDPIAGAAGVTGGFFTLSCVVELTNGIVQISVVNMSQSALSSGKFRELFRVVPVEDDEVRSLKKSTDPSGLFVSVQLEEESSIEPSDNLKTS